MSSAASEARASDDRPAPRGAIFAEVITEIFAEIAPRSSGARPRTAPGARRAGGGRRFYGRAPSSAARAASPRAPATCPRAWGIGAREARRWRHLPHAVEAEEELGELLHRNRRRVGVTPLVADRVRVGGHPVVRLLRAAAHRPLRRPARAAERARPRGARRRRLARGVGPRAARADGCWRWWHVRDPGRVLRVRDELLVLGGARKYLHEARVVRLRAEGAGAIACIRSTSRGMSPAAARAPPASAPPIAAPRGRTSPAEHSRSEHASASARRRRRSPAP